MDWDLDMNLKCQGDGFGLGLGFMFVDGFKSKSGSLGRHSSTTQWGLWTSTGERAGLH